MEGMKTLTTTLVACGLLLAGCGADDPSGATGSAGKEERDRDAMLAFAACMRENGIDMPDPAPGERGVRLMAPKGTTPEKMEQANEACRKHLDEIEPPDLTEEQQREFQEAALAHARCMREHGIDMPDPTFDEDGGAQIHIRKKGSGGPDPDSPKFREAQDACRDEMPNGGRFQESRP